MAEYIEREAAMRVNCTCCPLAKCPDDKCAEYRLLMDVPAADVVEVVRCKDCKYAELCYPSKCIGEEAEPAYVCNMTDKIVSVDGYCTFGAKMDGKGDGE